MNTISYRSTKVFGALVVLAAVVLTGCAATGGAVTSGAVTSGAVNGRAAAPVTNFAAPTAAYTVCSGGHASRFEEREEQGRVCRPVFSLQGIY